MDLLRDAFLKHKTQHGIDPPSELPLSSQKSIKKYAASVKSSGRDTIHGFSRIDESLSSFYHSLVGSHLSKRRYPEVSRLGVPTRSHGEPTPFICLEGSESLAVEHIGTFTAAHASSLQDGTESPWLSVVLYDYATPQSSTPRYFNEARVQGEVRLRLTESKDVESVDIWLIAKAENVLDITGAPFIQFHANLWNKSKGIPKSSQEKVELVSSHSMGKLPAGTYVFPFEFHQLPRDVRVDLPDEDVVHEGHIWVPLPPTSSFHNRPRSFRGFNGQVKYTVGVNVKYPGISNVDLELDLPFAYYPRFRPLPREEVPFPFLPKREDWPFHREAVGGWTLTPFGGRGHFRNEMVEIEGILGVQTPEVYVPGQIAKFKLLLWSTSSATLQALSHPDSFDVVFVRSEMYGDGVLRPRKADRYNRTLVRLSQGRIWRAEDGTPSSVNMPDLRPEFPGSTAHKKDLDTHKYGATLTSSGDDSERPRSHSPTPSLEDLDKQHEVHEIISLDGDVHVTYGLPPSFRHKYMGCEYIIHITITHPEYVHISPSGPGIQTETPLWIVTDPPCSYEAENISRMHHGVSLDPAALPVSGNVVEVDGNAVRTACALGEPTTKERPDWHPKRVAAF